MDFSSIIDIASAIIVSLGGAGAIIISVSTFLVNRIASRLEDKYQLKLNKELEQYKAILEQRTYVTKHQFDIELETYRNLTKGIFEFMVALNTTINKIDYPKKLSLCDNDKIEYEFSTYHKIVDKAAGLQSLLYTNAAFMPKQVYDEFEELIELTSDGFWKYHERFYEYLDGEIHQDERVDDSDKEMFDSINEKYNALNDLIRDYLRGVVIVD